MVNMLAEQPWLSSVLLASLGVILVFGWMQTGRKVVLAAGIGCLLLIPVAFAVASFWVTDSEQIRASIYRTADAVARNDFDAAVEIFQPAQKARIAAAKADLTRFHFDEARVNKLRSIDFVQGSVPPEAEVDLSVTVVVSDQRGQVRGMRVLRRVILKFRKSADGAWQVYDYNHLPIVGAPDGFSPSTSNPSML